jgi:hypothetical protein
MEEDEVKISRDEQKEANAAIYKKPVSSRVQTIRINTAKGDTKEKYIKSEKFSNGMVKNTLIGMKKNGKKMFGKAK